MNFLRLTFKVSADFSEFVSWEWSNSIPSVEDDTDFSKQINLFGSMSYSYLKLYSSKVSSECF